MGWWLREPNQVSRVRVNVRSVSGFKDCITMELPQGLGSGMKKNWKLKRQLIDRTEPGDNPRMAMEVWLRDGFLSLIHLENRDGAPDGNRQSRRGACFRQGKKRCLVYTRACGICLCSRRVFAEKIKGGAMSLERDLVAYGNKRERKDSLKISGTICRQKWLDCFKISLTRCRNVFDKYFHHRHSKGKCHPKYIRPTKSANQSRFTMFQKSFFFF